MKRLSLLLLLASSSTLFCADDAAFKKISLHDAAVVAGAALCSTKSQCARSINNHAQGSLKVKADASFSYENHDEEKCYAYIYLIEDAHKNLHVAFGSDSKSKPRTFHVSTNQKHHLHKVVNKWQRDRKKVSALIGYNEGAMFALKLMAEYKKDYQNAKVITFTNGFQIDDKEKRMIQCALKSDHLSVISQDGTKRLKRTRHSGDPLKDMRASLKGIQWSDVL